jgi:hypothetical protein
MKPHTDGNRNQNVRIRYSFLKILTGSDLSRRRLPLMEMQSVEAGPVIWLTACAHGDEVGGIVIIQEIFRRLRRQGLKRGAVYAFPLMNPLGFETISRSIPFSEEDLNRSFPGREQGSLGERIAARIFKTITDTNPALVIDLHNDWIRSIPYALIEPATADIAQPLHERVLELARQSGLLVVRENETEPATLSYSLLARGIPALTLEMGESYVVNESNIRIGLNCVWNLLAALGMTEPQPDGPYRYSLVESDGGRVYEYSDQPVCSTSGIIRFMTKPGTVVERGQIVARVYNAFGKPQETLHARSRGIVLGHADSPVVFPGMPVIAFAS